MTFTANQRLTIVLSFLSALFVTFVVAYNIGTTEPVALSHRVLYECESVEVGTDVGAMLHSNGYNLEFLDADTFIAHSPGCGIVSEEDGSGRQFDENFATVRTFEADTFYWNCVTQGNRSCG